MRKSFILFAFLLGCIGLQAQNYHITLHRSGSVIHNNDVNEITEIVFQGHSPASMVINTESGAYSFPITRFDSITFHTEQNDIPHGYDFLKICENELPYTWHGVTFYESGIQNITLQTPQGNDSIVSLNLSVYPNYETEEYMTVCPSALPIVWNGVTFYEAGTESVSMQTIYGCDSIMTLHLSVSETLIGEEYITICESELPYTWHGLTFTASGTQTLTLPSSQGCDSIVTLHLTAHPTQYGDDYLTIYDNQLPYIWHDITFTGEGSQTVTLQTEYGCDSIVTLHLTVVAAPTGDTVYITYNGSSVSVVNPFASNGVTVSNTGADVVVNSTLANVPYVISGSSSNGSLTMYSSNGFFMALNNLSLTSTSNAAINIASEVDVMLQLRGNSTLVDDANSAVNGAFYAAGSLTINGNGTLQVTGNAKHGILVEGVMTVNSGTINIPSTDSDGIHGSSNLVWNNGTLNIVAPGSDGLDFTGTVTIANGNLTINTTTLSQRSIKVTGAFSMTGGTLNININGDDCKGIKGADNISISGGTVDVQISGTGSHGISSDTDVIVSGNADITVVSSSQDGKCIKSDGSVHINGGTMHLTHSANASKGISATGDVVVTGGDITITASGSMLTEVVEGQTVTSYCTAVKSDANIYISGGAFHITLPTSNQSGKGISANGAIAISAGTHTLNISGNDSNGISSDTNVTVSNTADITITSSALDGKGIKSDSTINISGGTINITHSGNTSKGISADSDITISGGTIVINANGSTVVTDNEPSYCTAIKGDADININGGDITITLPTANQGGKGIKCAGNMTISGDNTIHIETHGDGATYTASSGTDTYSSSCLRAEGNMEIVSGNITLTSTGKGGKGIKVGTKTATGTGWGGTTYTYSGTYTQGSSDGTGPVLTISTTGAQVGGGGGGGWPPGPGGGSSSASASAKAIKVGGEATLYGGTTTVTTTQSGAEGLESKTQINVEGGQHYFKCYDDCMNSAGKIFFNGGVTVCFSNGNDAIDSNAGTAGAITIGDGVVFSYTTKGSPEEGFDCDNNSYIRITGTGIGISAGGSQGGGGGWPGGGGGNTITGAVQGYYFHTSSYSFQAGRYYTLSNTSGAGGTNMVTFSFEANCSSSLALITATGMQHGSTYYVKYSNTAPTNPTTAFHGLYLGGTSSASTQAFSFTAQ